MHNRRQLIALTGAASVVMIAGCSRAATPVADGDELFLGKADAPITLIEYASVACPVCAEWNNTVLPKFKAKYIDTGQVKLVLREINAHNPAFSTAGFLLARCAGKEKYFDVVDEIYHQQAAIEASGDYAGGLARIAQKHGINEKQMHACVSDPKAIAAQNARVAKFAQADNVNATPTFVMNGETVLEGYASLEQLDAIIASAKAR